MQWANEAASLRKILYMVLRFHSSWANYNLTDLPLYQRALCNSNHDSRCHSHYWRCSYWSLTLVKLKVGDSCGVYNIRHNSCVPEPNPQSLECMLET